MNGDTVNGICASKGCDPGETVSTVSCFGHNPLTIVVHDFLHSRFVLLSLH